MKTSYKILIAFFAIVLTSLIVCNLSLKAKYKNGDFDILKDSKYDVFQMNDFDKVPLKNFKHLVINGSIITKNGREIIFNPNLRINSNKGQNNILGLTATLKSLLKQHVSNDTLYISFQKNKINENNLRRLNYSTMILQTNNLQSLSVKNLACSVESLETSKPFTVTAQSSGVTLNYIKTDLLKLNIGKGSNVIFNGYNTQYPGGPYKINNLIYSIDHGSSITIANKELLGTIKCLNPSKYISVNYSKSMSIISATKGASN